ncbi:hypothetical protein BDV93DRAFT_259008 [Ceratobasidium sp. AG-I]|nr:hypothetical protein BDV93DRAFT_259008 [Ceratobasidium sp. AG-I]
MSESTTWYAVYSSNAFSTIFMGEEEVQEALQVYPEAQVESFTSFDEACVWLESAQIPAKIEPSDDKSLVGCSRTEKGKPHEYSPYKRPLGSGSQTHRGGRNPRHSKTPTRPKRSPSTANSSPIDIFGVRPTTKSEPLDPSSCESSEAAGILTSGPSRLQNVEKEVKSDYYVNRELESSYVDTPITHDPAQHDCARVTLSSEQRRVLDMVLDGQSVFFTGSAGTGKSVLLREIIEALHVRGENVAVTASTGIAAINIGGKTLHSFAGVGLGNQNTKNLIEKARNKRTTKRWRRTKVLIIDEGKFRCQLPPMSSDMTFCPSLNGRR